MAEPLRTARPLRGCEQEENITSECVTGGGMIRLMESKWRCESLQKRKKTLWEGSHGGKGHLQGIFSIFFCCLEGLALPCQSVQPRLRESVPALILLLPWWALSSNGKEGPIPGSQKCRLRWGESTGQIPEFPILGSCPWNNVSRYRCSSNLPM